MRHEETREAPAGGGDGGPPSDRKPGAAKVEGGPPGVAVTPPGRVPESAAKPVAISGHEAGGHEAGGHEAGGHEAGGHEGEGAGALPTPDEDAGAIELARSGQVAGFRALYDKYGSRIHSFARRFLADDQHAEDVTQEVFLQVFRKLAGFRGDSKFSTWLFRVTVNSCKNKRRTLERERRLDPVTYVERARANDPGAPPERELGQRELRDEIERSLAALTDEQRSIVLLKSVRGLSYKEIGDVIGQSEAQVRGKLYRARKVFRDSLALRRRSAREGASDRELEAEVLAELGE